jgi:isoleucyl-tRNA synthetase
MSGPSASQHSSSAPESVHLADWPEFDAGLVNEDLSARMGAARRVVALGRAARNAAAIKTRQPLGEVVIVSEDGALREGVESLKEIVLDELNVKELRFGATEDVTAYDLKPDLGVVGPRYGRLVPHIRSALAEASPETGARAAAGESVTIVADGEEVTLTPGELLVEPTERPGYALERDVDLAVALSTELSEELVDEGLVRELVHGVQNLRREKGFEIEEFISVSLSGSERFEKLLSGRWGGYFKNEVLARDLAFEERGEDKLSVDGETVGVRLERLG